ncbi:hypothetical protein MKW94_013017 [Papaver nudicaule]|uniref:Uncharacterized protein n=1 Tax=Papaver nudicaule TaxID=74823 RepID=A0AA41S1Y4_PAPNU|nr:hypothetical protein [Papaver nudicaule]
MNADQTNKTWSNSLIGELELTEPKREEEHWKKESIFELPTFVKDRNVKAYEPQVVSIGPYHYSKPHLKPMEVHKRRAIRHFVKRGGEPIQSYKKGLLKDVHLLRESYARQLDEEWTDDNRFVELMIQDGCFILEFLSAAANYYKENDTYALSDPMFSYYGTIVNYNPVMHDLLLVENQLPYLVLFTLWSINSSSSENEVNHILSWMMFAPNEGPGLHMLDMYMKGLLRGGKQFEEEIVVKRCASELHHQSGVQFKKVGSYQDIKFDKSTATLQLPSVIINDYNASTLLNLLAYELRVGTGRDMNSYIYLIDSLVDSAKDVRLLQSQGIIVSSMGSDDAVVKVLKDLARDTVVDSSCMSYLAIGEMNKYYEDSMNKWRRRFREWRSKLYLNYFSNPWTVISVAGAALLLVLTVIQTAYTVLSFYSDHPGGKKR